MALLTKLNMFSNWLGDARSTLPRHFDALKALEERFEIKSFDLATANRRI